MTEIKDEIPDDDSEMKDLSEVKPEENISIDEDMPIETDTDKESRNQVKMEEEKADDSSSALKTPKIKPSQIEDNELDAPEGWKRTVVQRQVGVSAGKYDIYYYSPTGKKLRSKKEVIAYCEKNDISIDFDEFKFSQGPGRNKNTPPKLLNSSKAKKTPAEKVKTSNTKSESPDLEPKKLSFKMDLNQTGSNKKEPVERKKKRLSKTTGNVKISSTGLTKVKLKPKTGWVPPQSPFSLFQEKLHKNPWQLLIGTIFLNKSSGDENISSEFLVDFLKEWPTAVKVMNADWEEVAKSLKSMNNAEKKSKMIIKFSEEFVNKNWTYPKELHGIGKFGNDSYRVFCVNEWKKVKPSDFLLNFYVDWLWDNHNVLGID